MKKNVGSQIIGAQMVNASTGAAFTGAVTIYVTGDGGTQAAGSVGSGACTHEGNGFHTYVPAQAETNYDHIGFTFTGTGAVPATVQVYTTFPQTGDSFARIGAPTGASISADLVTIDTVVDSILVDTAEIGAAGAGLTNIGTIATVTNLTNLPTIPANWITAAGIDTGAIDADALAADAGTEIGTAVWASAARTLTAATNITSTGGTTVPQTGDSFARLGAPAGASVSADIDAISAQIDSIGSGTGAALNFAVSEDNASAPIKTISSVGTQTGTYANTLADDGTTHQIASVGNAIDWVYGFDCGPAKSASKVVLRSNMAATGDTVTVSAYNFSTLGWDVRTTITGTAETLRDVPLLSVHTGTGADEGKVYTRFTFSEADAGTLVIDEAYVQAQQSGSLTGYALGAIWINTAGSNTNTVPYVDGTADNPVSTWAAALTLSAAIGIKRFKMAAGSSITLTADSSEYELLGDGLWSLALGGQDVSNSYFLKASVSGTGAGTNSIFEDCQVNASTSTGPAYFVRSGFNTPSGSPFNAAAAGQYVFTDCISLVAGSGTPYFDFAGTGGATGVNFRRWSGGSNTTLDSNCVMTMEVVTGGGQTVTTGGANVEVRGICRAVSVVLSASETVQVAAVTGPVTISGSAVAATVNLYGVHGVVTNTSTGSTVNALGQIAAILADTNELQTDWTNGGRLDLLIDAIKVVTDALPNSGALTDLATAAALATVDGVVDSILLDTAEIGAAGAGLTAVPWNASWDAQVESEVTDALNAYDPPTKAELDSGLAALNDLDAAGVATAVWNAATATYGSAGSYGLLVETNLDAPVSTVDTVVDSIKVDTAAILADTADMQPKLGTPAGASISADIAAIEAQTDDIGAAGAGLSAIPWNASWDAEVQSEVADALAAFWTTPGTLVDLIWDEAIAGHAGAGSTGEALAGATAPTAAAVADAVWEEAIADHSGTSGSTAEALAAAGGAGDPWITSLPGSYTGTQAGKILADILVDTGTTLDGKIDTIDGIVDAILVDTGTTLDGKIDVIDGNVDSILVDTAEIGAAGAGLTALATAAALATVDTEVGNLQTDVTAILADTADIQPKIGTPAGASVSADIAAIKVDTAATLIDTAELQTDWANGGRLDLLIDAIKVVTDALPNSGSLSSLATAAALATVDGNVDSILVDTDTTIPGLISALNDLAASDILTTALVESYAADGAAPTLSQAIFLIQQFLYERATAGTTVTVKKLDGATTAATLTLDDDTTPTSITRAT